MRYVVHVNAALTCTKGFAIYLCTAALSSLLACKRTDTWLRLVAIFVGNMKGGKTDRVLCCVSYEV